MANQIIKQEQVMDMNNLSQHKIAQANQLIDSVARMDSLPMKLFELAVGGIDSTGEASEARKSLLDKNLVVSFLPQTEQQKVSNQYLAEVMYKLQKTSVFSFQTANEQGQIKEVTISPITSTEITEGEDVIVIRFAPEIMPYITELKHDFTQYSLADISRLGSRNEIAIYKMLMRYFNEYRIRERKHTLSPEARANLLNPMIQLSQIRYITDTTNKYSAFKDFERFVLKKAITSINKHTEFAITYNKHKSGRRISKIQFHISKAGIIADPHATGNQPAAARLNQPATASQPQPATADLTEFLTNRYTAMLMANQLINPAAITTNEALRLDYLTKLYPLYTEFTAKYDGQKLQQHLAYVAEHKSGDANLDYLIHALADYQSKLAHPASTPSIATSRPKHNRINESLPEWARDDAPYVAEPVSDELIRKSKEALAQLRQQEKALDNQSNNQ